MGLEEFTVEKNTGHVEQATAAMGAGQLNDIEHRAKASVTTAKVESAKAEEAEKDAKGSSEGRLYGDIAADAVGLKAVSAAVEMIGERIDDKGGASPFGGKAVHIDADIAGANRSPGVYRSPAEQNAFGANTPAKTKSFAKAPHTEDLMASANIASLSLNGQGKEALGTWDVKETKMDGVQAAKQLTFGQELANEKALASVHAARQQHSAMIGMANQMSPGLSLSSGPSIRPQDLLKEAREQEDTDRWRTQS